MSTESREMDASQNTSSATAAQEAATEATTAMAGFDLTAAPVKQAADNADGAWMHLAHPTMGHPLYVGPQGSAVSKHGELNGAADALPVRVKVRYARSKAMVSKRRQLDRNATLSSGGKVLGPEAEDEAAKAMVRYSIMEFDNVIHNGTVLDASRDEHKDLFLSMADEYTGQVAGFSTELSNFFDVASGG